MASLLPPDRQPVTDSTGLISRPWLNFLWILIRAVQSGSGGGGAPTTAEYVLGAADGALPNGRVPVDTATVDWDLSIANAISANVPNLSGTNTGDVTLAGTPDYLTLAGQVLTRNQIDLATDVLGDLPLANLTPASAGSRLLGRGSSGAGDWQEVTLGSNLSMTGTVLDATGSGSGDVVGPGSATDNAITRFDGTTGKLIQNSGITIADGASGTLAGTNSGDVTLAGTPDYITISGQVITRAAVDLSADVTGDLAVSHLNSGSAASGSTFWRGDGTWASGPSGGGGAFGYPDFSNPQGLTFSWVNQGSATITTNSVQGSPSVVLYDPAHASTNLRCRVKSLPGASYTLTAGCFIASVPLFSVSWYPLLLRESGSGKIVSFGAANSASRWGWAVVQWSSATAVSSQPLAGDWFFGLGASLMWFQIEVSSGNRYYRYGPTRQSMVQIYTEADNTYATADQWGFAVNNNTSNSIDAYLTQVSLEEV